MSQEVAPAIRRAYGEDDRDTEVIHKYSDRVNFHRGLGETGYTLETVKHDCPACGFDRMLRQHRRHPDDYDVAAYWCLSPACVHYVSNSFDYARPRRQYAEEVEVVDFPSEEEPEEAEE